jgi:hypothetical protein
MRMKELGLLSKPTHKNIIRLAPPLVRCMLLAERNRMPICT